MKANRVIQKRGVNSAPRDSRKQASAGQAPRKTTERVEAFDFSPESRFTKPQHPALNEILPFLEERVDFKIPSDLKYLDGVLEYLNERMLELGIVEGPDSEILVALDEAIVNAIKHGNRGDSGKAVHIVAELSSTGACFTVTDEGSGFVREEVPDPTDPSRLLEPSGRGILLISHIMDEVCYNKCGNEIKMSKRRI